jgi:egghead protein (zeste-white 4 protein)
MLRPTGPLLWEGRAVVVAHVDIQSTGAHARVFDPSAIKRAIRGATTWRFNFGVALGTVLAFGVLFGGGLYIWPDHGESLSGGVSFAWLSLSWLLYVPMAVCGLVGLLMYRQEPVRPAVRYLLPIRTLVVFRIVSRGDNRRTLLDTIANIRNEMQRLPLFPYRIEIVTDLDAGIDRAEDLAPIVVPAAYETRRGSLFKARALHYAVTTSALPDDVWIMHLDEESHVTPSVIVGIRRAVGEEEASGLHRTGQGKILYHRHLKEHRILTLADSLRTADDIGRFHLQYRAGWPWFGIHGSFILCRNNVERSIGFDFGPVGSVTEDAWWAAIAMKRGYRFRWVEGHVIEQSPHSARDFVKQRRRWFVGLALVVCRAPMSIAHRTVLGSAMIFWGTSWIGLAYALADVIMRWPTPLPIRAGGDLGLAIYAVHYLVGLRANLSDRDDVSIVDKAFLYLMQVVLMPVFASLECAGVLCALVRPSTGFHVVRKDGAYGRRSATQRITGVFGVTRVAVLRPASRVEKLGS